MQDLSDRDSRLPFMMPPAAQFAEAIGRYGIGEGNRVVLYDACRDRWAHMWAARVWWMLRAFGFDRAAVLNGGFHKWTLEGRPVSTEPSGYPPASRRGRARNSWCTSTTSWRRSRIAAVAF